MSQLSSSRILIDTSVIIAYLRRGMGAELLLKTIEGRAPVVSPITVHELRRGIRPASPWEPNVDRLIPPQTVVALPPSSEDWIEAADVIRSCFGKSRSKEALATLAHDVLITLTARSIQAELWSRDNDFKTICQAVGVPLLSH